MATLAKLVVKLVADVTEFSKGMDTAVQKYAKIGKSMAEIGDKMTLRVTLPLIAAGGAAIKFASDLEETRNKTATVFGDMAGQVMEMGKSADIGMGMSENAALSFASTFGAIEKNMGLTTDQVAEMSIQLTQLTADYASFHNLAPEEAFEKIKAGLVGSSEPLISLGKDLRVTAVEAYAMAHGIGKAGEALNNQELALARYGLLLSQSGDEMGDFSKTADGLANSTRTVKALFENTLASFGETLLPIATQFMQALIPILNWFNTLPQPVKTGIVYLLLFAAAIGPVLSVGGRLLQMGSSVQKIFGAKGLISVFSKLAPLVGGAGGGLAAFGSALLAAIGPALALGSAIALLILVIKYLGPQAWNTVKMIVAIIGELVKRGIAKIKELEVWVGNLLIRIAVSIYEKSKTFFAAGRNLMIGLVNGIKSAAAAMIEAVLRPVQYVIEQVKRMLNLHSPSKVFEGIGANMMLGLAQGIEKYAPKSIDANLKAVGASVSGVMPAGIGGSGSRQVSQHNEFVFYGDMSESAKKSLKIEFGNLIEKKFIEVLG